MHSLVLLAILYLILSGLVISNYVVLFKCIRELVLYLKFPLIQPNPYCSSAACCQCKTLQYCGGDASVRKCSTAVVLHAASASVGHCSTEVLVRC